MVQYRRRIFVEGLKIIMEPGTFSSLLVVLSIIGFAAVVAVVFFRSWRRDEDFAISERVVLAVSPTFHEAIGKVRGERRRRMLYALDGVTGKIRQLVDYKDDSMGLDVFRKALYEMSEKRRVNQPVLKSLKHIRRRLGPDYDFSEYHVIIGARKRDFEHKGFQTLDDLYAYGNDLHGSRIALLVRPFAHGDDHETKACVDRLARAITIARTLLMIGDDYRMERIYVPRNAMTKARYLSYELRHGVINDAFKRLFEDLAKRAETDLDEVLFRIKCFPRAIRKMMTYIVVTEKGRIEACRNDGYEVFYKNHDLDFETRQRLYRSYRKDKARRKAEPDANKTDEQ